MPTAAGDGEDSLRYTKQDDPFPHAALLPQLLQAPPQQANTPPAA